MSGGGGKGGSKTQETTIPAWIRDPAIRNLQRAEDVQRIEYMPYYGADVAAFTPTQNAAFDANIGAAEAFGLLAPNTLTATSGMPEPTDFNGFSAYSSQPLYESALAELKANQPDAVAQYDALFGSNVPTTRSTGQGGFSGSANFNFGGGRPSGNAPINTPDLVLRDRDGNIVNSVAPEMTVSYNPPKLDAYGNLPSAPLTTPNFNLAPPSRPSDNYRNEDGISSPTNVGNPMGYGMGK